MKFTESTKMYHVLVKKFKKQQKVKWDHNCVYYQLETICVKIAKCNENYKIDPKFHLENEHVTPW